MKVEKGTSRCNVATGAMDATGLYRVDLSPSIPPLKHQPILPKLHIPLPPERLVQRLRGQIVVGGGE